MLWRCALVNILTEAFATQEDSNDSVSCYSLGAGRAYSFGLLYLLLCHLFISTFSVNRKGPFSPMPVCDGAFFTAAQNQQQLNNSDHGPVSNFALHCKFCRCLADEFLS